MYGLEGKVAIVTGGSRGIGAAIARRLADGGARVTINYRSRAAEADAVVKAIGEAGGSALAVAADVGESGSAAKIVSTTLEHFGRLDIVVNNAGVSARRLLPEIDLALFRSTFDTNVLSVLEMIQAAAPNLPAGGRIINVTSLSASIPYPGGAVYAASKAAVDSLTRSLAAELARRQITVNSVAPGLIETDMIEGIADAFRQRVVGHTMLGRVGVPEDIAGVVAFLTSDEARWITGKVIGLDGGHLAF